MNPVRLTEGSRTISHGKPPSQPVHPLSHRRSPRAGLAANGLVVYAAALLARGSHVGRRRADGPPAEAILFPLDSPLDGIVAPLGAVYYRISSDVGGRLTVMLQASEFAARASLVTLAGQPLVQSDGPANGTGDGLIDVNVPAGDDYVEVQSLGGGGHFRITADLLPTDPAFQTIPSNFNGYAAIGVGDFNGDGTPDVVAPDGIHLGVGNGTFQSTVVAGPLAQNGWTVTAIAVGDFNDDGRPDIAFAETSPDETTADVRVLQNEGDCQFPLVGLLDVDSQAAAAEGVYPQPVAIQTIDPGHGIVELAIADSATGNVRILVGNGQGGFSLGPILDGGVRPSALAWCFSATATWT